MSSIFLSHSAKDNFEAVALSDWLAREGWDDVFLDLDPDRGIAAGERWERALHEQANRCEAVIFLVSANWLASGWCMKEYTVSRALNKKLFAVVIDPAKVDLPPEYKGTWQAVDLSGGQDGVLLKTQLPGSHAEKHVVFSQSGLRRLKRGLDKAGLDPKFFAWPPEADRDRAPFRGLKPLEGVDAGILFGRDAPIIEAADRLRGLKSAAPPRLLVILGASGAGKSSFLRAGLLPRLGRDDRNFVALPVIRPERAALTGENGLLHALEAALPTRTRADLRRAIEAGASGVRSLLAELAARIPAADGEKPPTIVLAVDQAEELFRPEGAVEGAALLALIRDLAREDAPALIAIFAIRSDSYDALEHAKPLEGFPQTTLPLLPMPRGAYKDVIEGPARRFAEAGGALTIEPQLTERLLEDIAEGGGSDALPLLAFTLEQLFLDYRRAGALRLQNYEDFDGLKGAIDAAVERAFVRADADPRIPKDRKARETLLRRGLIPWLAGIDPETRSSRRSISRRSEIPAEAAPLIDLLVEERLLSTDTRVERDASGAEARVVTIEPAHEALLRQWGLLQGWLEEDFALLATLEGVKRAARDWEANGRAEAWLAHQGQRLAEAQGLDARADIAAKLDEGDRAYLSECQRVAKREERNKREADDKLTSANTAARNNLCAALSALSIATSVTSPTRAVKLALAAWPRCTEDKTPKLGVTTAALGTAVVQSREREIFRGHYSRVWSAAFSPDGTRVVTASRDKTARLWDAVTGAAGVVLHGHEDEVRSAAFSPDGTHVVTASHDKTARLWDVAMGVTVAVLRGHDDKVVSAAFSPDGTRVVTASDDKTARLWDAVTGSLIAFLRGTDYGVRSAAFSPDGTRVVTVLHDNTARLWDVATGATVSVLRGHDDKVVSAAFSPDGTRVVTASTDKTARLADATTGSPIAVLRGHEAEVQSAVFSADGTRVVTASTDNTARLWDPATGAPTAILRGHDDVVRSATFSPDGTRVITASHDNTARLWDAGAGSPIAVLRGHDDLVFCAAFSPDGTRVVTASHDNTARLWDVVTGLTVAVLSGHDDSVSIAAFSPFETRIVTASADKTARLWDIATGAPIVVLRGHDDAVRSAVVSPDGKRIVTASADRTARLWDAATGAPIFLLSGHDDKVVSAAFSSDGTRVVTASEDRTARLWDVATGTPIAVLRGHEGWVESAAFSPDGALVVTASWDKTGRLWNLSAIPKGNIFQIACAWLPDHDLTEIARDYGLTNLEPICEGNPPLPDWIGK